MATLRSKPEIVLKMTLELNEIEVRALEAIVGYDIESYLRVFYKEMGKAYLEKYEEGLRSLFKVRPVLNLWLGKVEMARKAFEAEK
jgi:DNA-binding ferritin-like protein (Dps family)